MTITDFLVKIAADTYPEPRSQCHDTITSKMIERVAPRIAPGGVVLDIGCGQGPALEWFRDHGFQAAGIALNPEDVRVCRERGLTVLQMDQNAMTFTNASCDAVWARHVLEHSIAPYFTLNEFSRVLRHGGILYVEVPAPDTSCQHETNQNHYSVMGANMWASLIKRAGFEIHEAGKVSFETPLGPDHYLSFICRKL